MAWDQPLTGDLLREWKHLLEMMKEAKIITIPRLLFPGSSCSIQSAKLVGFCDASSKAYAAIVYLKLETEDHLVDIKFVAAKTRVAPVGGMTIPRLELLSALVLSKLIDGVHAALKTEFHLSDSVCFTDSKVALFWIQGTNHEWKQFVENRASTIRSLVPPHHWRHCPGKQNPADIPSRGMSVSELADTPLWLCGPDWLREEEQLEEPDRSVSVPEECRGEMKCKEAVHLLSNIQSHNTPCLSALIDPRRYSSAYRLIKVTGLVLRFVRCLRARVTSSSPASVQLLNDFEQAKLRWIRDCQSQLQDDGRFASWKRQLDLFEDESGVWRCGGRMAKSCLSLSAKNPILLDRSHHFAIMVVHDAHLRVLHNGVKETLTELRSQYWLLKGRQFVRKMIHSCTVCKKLEGRPCWGNPPHPLQFDHPDRSRPLMLQLTLQDPCM